jgi:hypothetical protein
MGTGEHGEADWSAIVAVGIAAAYACVNLYVCYVAVHSLPGLDGVPQGYADANPLMRAIISACRSGWFVSGLAISTWLVGARALWNTHGKLRALGLSALLTGLAWLGSVYVAVALWDS